MTRYNLATETSGPSVGLKGGGIHNDPPMTKNYLTTANMHGFCHSVIVGITLSFLLSISLAIPQSNVVTNTRLGMPSSNSETVCVNPDPFFPSWKAKDTPLQDSDCRKAWNTLYLSVGPAAEKQRPFTYWLQEPAPKRAPLNHRTPFGEVVGMFLYSLSLLFAPFLPNFSLIRPSTNPPAYPRELCTQNYKCGRHMPCQHRDAESDTTPRR